MTCPRRRVLLVGWDAADWKMIHPLMDAGWMSALKALVERGTSGKLMTLSPEEMELFGQRMAEIHQRFLILPCPTVAAVNGHAFAGGAFVAMSCDYRIMREDRGWICVSEVDAGVPLPDSMMEVLRGKVPPASARDAILTGKRYAADEAIAAVTKKRGAASDEGSKPAYSKRRKKPRLEEFSVSREMEAS